MVHWDPYPMVSPCLLGQEVVYSRTKYDEPSLAREQGLRSLKFQCGAIA